MGPGWGSVPAMKDDALTTVARLERMFAQAAAATPQAPAIFFRGRVVSYGELVAQVEALAGELTRHGVGPGVLVALSLRRTPAMVAVLLAILKAGGAYLPLDARNPAERMAFVLSDSGAALLITDDGASPGLADFAGTVLELSEAGLVQRAYGTAPVAVGPPDLAYLIYTSGSTGAPKGVMLGHGATHLVEWARRYYSAEERARVAATTSLSFDPSIFEIFVPLCTGGALILKETALEPFAADEQPTLLGTVPSVLAELCRGDAIPASVQVLNVGGEALSGELARAVYRGRAGLVLDNHYGPTETTTVATVARIPRGLAGEPSIGRPVRGAEIVLLDAGGQPVADGETGEIHIGGPGLALGYLKRPDLTAQRFIHGPGGRLYRTGDLARWADGELWFAGRLDQQVKIRGFRVELGEVEFALMRVPEVEKALAMVREAAGRSQLVAYVQAQQALTPAGVRAALADWLPDYMLPARVVVLRAFPLLVSGKVDHAALPAPDDAPVAVVAGDVSRMEKPIIHVFEEVLARGGVGPDDSFFDLGGDSLASVQAALRLEEMLGYELPPALIHQSPTPRALARSLEHGRVRAEGHVSLLQPGGPGPPLFCMADLFGQPFNYLSLARRLGPDRAVYGVAPGPLQAAFTADGDIGRLTQGFLAELRRVRPRGPYLIAGYSAGGMLALDVARALEAEGEAVRLVLLDSSLHSRRPAAGAIAGWALAQAAGLFTPRGFVARARGTKALLGKLARRMAPGAPPSWIPRSQVAFAAAMIKAGAAYRPGPFGGPTLLIKARDRDGIDQLFDGDGMLGWSGVLTGEVVQASVAGGHHDFLREPRVAETAAAVRRFLLAHD
jgi:amino acid adenylation domain-containing protein